jgi:hypothetical protein
MQKKQHWNKTDAPPNMAAITVVPLEFKNEDCRNQRNHAADQFTDPQCLHRL